MRAAANKNKQSPAKSAGWDVPKSGAPFKQALDKDQWLLANGQQGVYSSYIPPRQKFSNILSSTPTKEQLEALVGQNAFGPNGLLSLRGKVPDKELDKALANFEQSLNAQRNSMEVLSSR